MMCVNALKSVIQAHHNALWLDQTNTITFELNNQAGVDLYADVGWTFRKNLTQNLPRCLTMAKRNGQH